MSTAPAPSNDNENQDGSRADLIARLCAEYDAMPGLVLTRAQLCRLFGVDAHSADIVLGMLVEAGVLVRTAGDVYLRRHPRT